MKKNSLLFFFFFLSVIAFCQESDECQKCGKRLVKCWDLDIWTAKPVSKQDSVLWKQLHYASDEYYKELVVKESPECLGFIPACRIADATPPWQKPCPRNSHSDPGTGTYDYQIFGDISGQEGAYVIRLTLTTLKWETITQVTKKFDKASEAKSYGISVALDLGGNNAGSRKLYDVIHEFELKKRDEAQGIKYNRIALNATVKFQSEKHKVKINQRLPFDIELKDCDDEPLKSALLELQVVKGKFENDKVETDENGIAHALYIAPAETGSADVKVEYNYHHPSEKPELASDFTTIVIVDERAVKFVSENYSTETGEVFPFDLKLEGCDAAALKTAVLELSAQKGKFQNNRLKPDENGIAHGVYIAPDQAGNDLLKVEYTFKYPAGKPGYSSDTRPVEIVKPVTQLNGSINVLLTYKTTDKQSGEIIHVSQGTEQFSTQIKFYIAPQVVQNFVEHPKERWSPENRTKVLEGDSWVREYDYEKSDKPLLDYINPVNIKKYSSAEGFESVGDKKQWVKNMELNCETTTKQQHVSVLIKPFIDPASSPFSTPELSPLTTTVDPPPYIIDIEAPMDPTILMPDKTNSGVKKIWDDDKQALVDDPPPYDGFITYTGYMDSKNFENINKGDKSENTDKLSVTPLLFKAAEFDKFIMKPVGSFTISAVGDVVHITDQKEVEQRVTVTITLTPIK